MLGDFNAVLVLKLHRSSDSTIPGFPPLLMQYKRELDLTHIWRAVRGNQRNHTFFSYHHKSYSRIDLVLASEHIKDKVVRPVIGLWTLSDHASVVAELREGPVHLRPQVWHLC